MLRAVRCSVRGPTLSHRLQQNHRLLSASFSSAPSLLPASSQNQELRIDSTDSSGVQSPEQLNSSFQHRHDIQRQTQHAVKSLVDTLLASQMLLPRPSSTSRSASASANHTSTAKANGQDPWVVFFADLGSSSVVSAGEETTTKRARKATKSTARTVESYDHTANVIVDKRMTISDNKDSDATLATRHQIQPTNVTAPAATTATVSDAATAPTPSLTVDTETETRFVDQTPPQATSDNSGKGGDPNVRRMEHTLARFIQQKNPQRAMDTFHLGLRYETADQLQPDTVRQLFFLMAKKRPFDAYKVLQLYRKITAVEHDKDVNAYADMFERNCDALRYMDPEKHRYSDIHKLVRGLVMDLQQLDRVGKEQCYPVLVSALVSQKSVSVGDFARLAYQYMIQHNFDVGAGYWEHLLSMSRYFRQKDLPYASILRRIVDMGRRPDPVTALAALENLFPYTDVDATYTALKAIVDLQSTAKPEDEFQYMVDISALEVIGAAAARRGHFVLCLLIWDLVDLLGYKPTEAIFENTIMAFAVEPTTYGNAFTVMADMEANGYEPSRALIRGFSVNLRAFPSRLDTALEHLKVLRQKGTHVSVASLNAILSGGAERGDVDRTLFVMEEFSRNDVEPNADSFSFAFEALGKNIARRTRNPASKQMIESYLETADSFLTELEERGIAPNHHIIREYVELLCLANEVDTATSVVKETLANGGLVNNKTIYRVAMANVNAKNFAIARELTLTASEPLPFLLENIERAEQRDEVETR